MKLTNEKKIQRLVVAQLTDRWLPQTQTWIHTQISHLPASVESHVVCRSAANLEQFGISRLHCLERYFWRRGLYALMRRLGYQLPFEIAQVRRCHARVIHSHFGNIGWSNLEVAAQTHARHVVTFYGGDLSLPQSQSCWASRYHDMFTAVDCVLCEGPHMAERVVNMGCPREKVKVQHLGVDVAAIRFQPRQWRVGEPLKVLLAGTFTEKKGFPDAIEALALVSRYTDVQLTIIGDARPAAEYIMEKQRIMSTLARSGLLARTRLLGYQPYQVLMEESYRHHVFLSPSVTAKSGDSEGGAPVVLIDMAASGMPIVSTFHCDIPNVVVDQVTGYLAQEHDIAGIAEQFRKLTTAPDHWTVLVAAARRRMEEEFNAPQQGERLGQIYHELFAGPE